jgi:formamidopyrimidine-DNA glycosylase
VPELPDLEVVRDILAPRIVGRTVRGVEVNRPTLVQSGREAVASLVGAEIRALGRRGKYLVLSFAGTSHLLIHLMRWGWLWHGSHGYSPTTATDLRLSFDDGSDLRLIEGRSPRLAAAWLVPDLLTAEPLQKLGWEPLSETFTAGVFHSLIRGKRRQLKRALTGQSLIAGIGNAYADEILFRAKLSPVRYAHTLTPDEATRLWEAIPTTLRWAIAEIRARTGDSLFDREIRNFLCVHGRKNSPCVACGSVIAEILHDGVRTNYCPRCQAVGQSGGARSYSPSG